MLHVPATPKPILRAYSIASSDKEKNSVGLIFKYVPQGVASEFVWKMKAHDEFLFTGPFGKVFLKEPACEQMIFLCTGSGVAQHICFLKSHLDQLRDKNIHFFMGLTNESDIYFEEELKKISKNNPVVVVTFDPHPATFFCRFFLSRNRYAKRRGAAENREKR